MADTGVDAEKKLKPFRWVTGYKIYVRMSKYFYMHLVRILPPQSCKARQLESAPHKESHVQIYLSPVSQEYKMHKTVIMHLLHYCC